MFLRVNGMHRASVGSTTDHLASRVHCGAHQSARNRRAFTLIEVILALALSVVLLGAIFAAIDHAWRLSARGREEMERSQLARALISQIACDIRSVSFTPPPPQDTESSSSTSGTTSSSGGSSSGSSGSSGSSSGSSSSSSSSGSSSSSSSSTSSSSTPTITLKSIGIQGTATRIELHITRPRRDFDFTAGVDGSKQQTHFSDLVAVQYHLGMMGGGTGTGLIRTEGDRLTILTNESKGGTADSSSKQQLLAQEVEYIHFRYFDGMTWYPFWQSGPPSQTIPPPETTSTSGSGTSGSSSSSGGSGGSSSSGGSSGSSSSGSSGSSSSSSTGTTVTSATSSTGMGRVPRAIEITIGLAPPRVHSGPFLRVGFNNSTSTFRSVVVIPISDPLPAEFTQ